MLTFSKSESLMKLVELDVQAFAQDALDPEKLIVLFNFD